MNPNSFTEIKKHVGGSAQSPAALYLFEHDGAVWASNRYWVTPAPRVAPLLERFNLDSSKPGAFEVNGTVHRANGDNNGNPVIPDLSRHLDPAAYAVPLVPVMVAGRHAHVPASDARGVYLAVYGTGDGAFLGLETDTLTWLSAYYALPTEEGYYYGQPRYVTTEPSPGKNRSAGIVADLMHTTEPGRNEDGTYIPSKAENLGPRVTGIIASVKLGS
jgi:hypothetical protein